jgi:hypothetical protein
VTETPDGSQVVRHIYHTRGAAYYATTARLWLLARLCYSIEQTRFRYRPAGAVEATIHIGPRKGMSAGTREFLSAKLWPWPDNHCGEGGDCNDDIDDPNGLSGVDADGNQLPTWQLILNAIERDAEDRNGRWHSIAPHVAEALSRERTVLVLPLSPPCYGAHLTRHAWTVEGSP